MKIETIFSYFRFDSIFYFQNLVFENLFQKQFTKYVLKVISFLKPLRIENCFLEWIPNSLRLKEYLCAISL